MRELSDDRVVTRRVLIVTSSYAPTMIADMHRARHLAWELPRLNWDVEILAPDTAFQQSSCIDADSGSFFFADTPLHYVKEYFPSVFRTLNMRAIGWRALMPMLFAGWRLIRKTRYDAIYISTTNFPLFLLGPVWKAVSGVPYVLDIHDPCFQKGITAPGGSAPSAKHLVSHWIAGFIEWLSVPAASGIVSVSPCYIDMLKQRFAGKKMAWLADGRAAVIPFAASARDLEISDKSQGAKGAPADGKARIIYVGAGGPIMERAFSLICRALADLRTEGLSLVDEVRIELYGTFLGWREGMPKHMAELANKHGIGDIVHENPRRVTYARSLELLLGGSGALILGVEDAGYMPSKLYMYALSGKPLLASLYDEGVSLAQFRADPALGHALWFGKSEEMSVDDAAGVVKDYLQEVATNRRFDRREILQRFSVEAMACRHAELFEAVCRAQ